MPIAGRGQQTSAPSPKSGSAAIFRSVSASMPLSDPPGSAAIISSNISPNRRASATVKGMTEGSGRRAAISVFWSSIMRWHAKKGVHTVVTKPAGYNRAIADG